MFKNIAKGIAEYPPLNAGIYTTWQIEMKSSGLLNNGGKQTQNAFARLIEFAISKKKEDPSVGEIEHLYDLKKQFPPLKGPKRSIQDTAIEIFWAQGNKQL